MTLVRAKDFSHLDVGDRVTRMLGGLIPIKMIVSRVDDDLIYCVTPSTGTTEWTFKRTTGAEVDLDIGFDGVTSTGSYLKE